MFQELPKYINEDGIEVSGIVTLNDGSVYEYTTNSGLPGMEGIVVILVKPDDVWAWYL